MRRFVTWFFKANKELKAKISKKSFKGNETFGLVGLLKGEVLIFRQQHENS